VILKVVAQIFQKGWQTTLRMPTIDRWLFGRIIVSKNNTAS